MLRLINRRWRRRRRSLRQVAGGGDIMSKFSEAREMSEARAIGVKE